MNPWIRRAVVAWAAPKVASKAKQMWAARQAKSSSTSPPPTSTTGTSTTGTSTTNPTTVTPPSSVPPPPGVDPTTEPPG